MLKGEYVHVRCFLPKIEFLCVLKIHSGFHPKGGGDGEEASSPEK